MGIVLLILSFPRRQNLGDVWNEPRAIVIRTSIKWIYFTEENNAVNTTVLFIGLYVKNVNGRMHKARTDPKDSRTWCSDTICHNPPKIITGGQPYTILNQEFQMVQSQHQLSVLYNIGLTTRYHISEMLKLNKICNRQQTNTTNKGKKDAWKNYDKWNARIK